MASRPQELLLPGGGAWRLPAHLVLRSPTYNMPAPSLLDQIGGERLFLQLYWDTLSQPGMAYRHTCSEEGVANIAG